MNTTREFDMSLVSCLQQVGGVYISNVILVEVRENEISSTEFFTFLRKEKL